MQNDPVGAPQKNSGQQGKKLRSDEKKLRVIAEKTQVHERKTQVYDSIVNQREL